MNPAKRHVGNHDKPDPARATGRDAGQHVNPAYNPSAVVRASVSGQVLAYLRRNLAEGRWKDELPSEAELCRELRVSRPTLRKAIGQLVKERRVIPGGKGKHHRILPAMQEPCARRGRIIRYLTPYPRASLSATHYEIFNGLRSAAHSAGYEVVYEQRPRLFRMRSPAAFGKLEGLPDTAGWVLMYSTRLLQGWFESKGWPGVLAGMPYPGIGLPCIYPDTEAAARHAAGLFHARGYRRMAFLLPGFTSLGDRLAGKAFVAEAARLGSTGVIAGYKPEIADLRRTLDQLLVERPRPDAYFTNCPEHAVTLLCHLRNAGVAVPEEAAILCGWDDPFLDHAVPSIGRYRIDHARAGRRTGEMLLEVIRHGAAASSRVPILPDFVPGDSLRG